VKQDLRANKKRYLAAQDMKENNKRKKERGNGQVS
jgi:hypothetical protein